MEKSSQKTQPAPTSPSASSVPQLLKLIENDYTITAYAGLYCEGKNMRNLIQSMVGFGTITGLLVINYLSDWKGRKFGFLMALGIPTLSAICTSFLRYVE